MKEKEGKRNSYSNTSHAIQQKCRATTSRPAESACFSSATARARSGVDTTGIATAGAAAAALAAGPAKTCAENTADCENICT